MRVLVLGANRHGGGVAGYVNAIANNVEDENICFEAVVNQKYIEGKSDCLEIPVQFIELNRNIISFIESIIKTRRAIKKINPDIIHMHTLLGGVVGVFSSILLGIPKVYTGHGWRSSQKNRFLSKLLFELIEIAVVNLCERVTCLSESEKHKGLNFVIRKKTKICQINTRINIDLKLENKKPLSSLINIINIGELDSRKNPYLFIEIMRKFDGSNVRFKWVGGGLLFNEIQKFLGSNDVFDGPLEKKEVFNILNESDILLVTSLHEGVPLVIIEAMLTKTLVISNNYEGVKDIINDGVTGMVFNGTSEDAYRCINEAINGKSKKSIIESAYSYALNNHYNEKLMADAYLNIYKDLKRN